MRGAWLALGLYLMVVGCKPSEPPSPWLKDLEEITVNELSQNYTNGRWTIRQVVEAYLFRIDSLEPSLNAMISLNPDALEIADQLDRELVSGQPRGPLHGIPVILKDNIDTHDKMPTTVGSRAMANSIAPRDSWVASKLRESGAVILGKANLSEWANFHSTYSSSGWSGLGGQTNNPYDLSRNPCGSSSGSGVAVSANLCALAIGTETWGSIVCPSNNNGLVGIKPTVGLISRSGIVPISFTQDTPGPMARTVEDAALCLGALTGIDSTDRKTLDSEGNYPPDYARFLNPNGLEGKRIAIYFPDSLQYHRVHRVFLRAVHFLHQSGAEIFPISSITPEPLGAYSFQVMLYEFKDGLNKYFASLGEQSPVKDLQHLIDLTFADSIEMRYFNHLNFNMAQEKGDLESTEYLQALDKLLTGSREKGIDRVMDELDLDAIVTPTGGPAWKTDLLGGDRFGLGNSGPPAWAGYPSITVPMGFVEGLPVGISFFGRAWSEPLLLEIAYAYEQGTLHRRPPQFNPGD